MLLEGPAGSGKRTLVAALASRFGARVLEFGPADVGRAHQRR
jgi:cytidylate kinase